MNTLFSGRHWLFVRRYDWPAIQEYILDKVRQATGDTWHEIALKIGRTGHWEFEDYQPYIDGE